MPAVILPFPEEGKDDKETIRNLTDTVIKLRKELEFLLSNLDEENVIRARSAIISDLLAGTITADQIDVQEGKIQVAQIESLTVGDNVTMGPNATISWGSVTGTPPIPVLPSYIQATYIDATNVISPNITGGIITGALIRTTEANNRRIELSASGLITYDSSNNRSGVSIVHGANYFDSSLYFYHSGNNYAGMWYDMGVLTLATSGGADILLLPSSNGYAYVGERNPNNRIATIGDIPSTGGGNYVTFTDLANWMTSHIQTYHS